MLGKRSDQVLKSEALFLVDQLRSLRDRAGPSSQRILQAGEHLAEVVQIWNVMVGLYRPRSRRYRLQKR